MAWDIEDTDYPAEASSLERHRFLVRYAILAPSSHNSQPWLFDVREDRILVGADPERWLSIADADKRELYISVGCALENLLVAAEHFGYDHEVSYFPDGIDDNREWAADVRLVEEVGEPTPERLGLFGAMTRRRTNRSTYEDRPLEDGVLEQLSNVIFEPEVSLVIRRDRAFRRKIDQLTGLADARQFADPEWRRELGSWIGRGAFGNSWLMAKLGQLAVTHLNMAERTAEEDVELLDSAPVIGLLATADDSPVIRVRTGQAFERLWLQANVLRARLHPMNQILQVPDIKQQVRELLPDPELHPQVSFRMGHAEAPEKPSPRRPLEDVLVGEPA